MSGRPLRHADSTVMARLAAPTAARPTRLAVVADPHVSTRAAGSPKQFDRTESLLESTIEDINSRGVDAALSVGDLTKDGAPWDFDRLDELLAGLDAPFFAVPGNHDVPKTFDSQPSVSRGRFVDGYTPGTLPYQLEIGGVDVFGLDSASTPGGELRDSHDGRLTTGQLEWLTGRIDTADCPIVFTHHNLPPTARQAEASGVAAGFDLSDVPIMRDGEEAMDAFAAAEIPLVVTGHIHLPGVARDNPQQVDGTTTVPQRTDGTTTVPQRTDGTTTVSQPSHTAMTTGSSASAVTEVTAPSTCTFPQAYLLVDVDSRGTTVRYVPIGSERESMVAYRARLNGAAVDRGQAALAAVRTAGFPLVEEWLPTQPTAPQSTTNPLSGSSSVDD